MAVKSGHSNKRIEGKYEKDRDEIHEARNGLEFIRP